MKDPGRAGTAGDGTVPLPGGGSGRRPRAAGLWFAALAVSLALCGTEATSGGFRTVFAPDQFNALVLVMSFRDALLEGQLPPRVSPILSGGAGNPYHQFYSPLAYAVPAILSLPLGDAMAGHAAASLLFTALGFVYAWKLARLLTLSDAGAAAGAALFTTAPYLLCDRVLRGAWPEFAGFSLLPLTAYLLLRGANAGGARRLLPAAAGLAALSLTHLIASFLLALFLSLFAALWALEALRSGGREGRRALRKLGRRSLRIAAAGGFALALGAGYLAPMALYGDLEMRNSLSAVNGFRGTGLLAPLTGLLSPVDSGAVLRGVPGPERYQLGAVPSLAFAAFLRLSLGRRPPRARGISAASSRRPLHVLPMLLTAALAAGVVIAPEAASALFPPAAFTQFSYRYIMIFVLSAALMGAMALAGLFPAVREGGGGGAAAALALAAAVFAGPYLYPALPYTSDPRMGDYPSPVSEAWVYAEHPTLSYGDNAYFRWPPGPDRIGRGVPSAGGGGTAAERAFRTELSRAPRHPGDPGAVLLDVLWYPGLQEVRARLDGREFAPECVTFWQIRPGLGFFPADDWAFHGLAIRGLPEGGLLEAEVRFRGMRWANLASVAALSAWAAIALRGLVSRRRGARAPGAGVGGRGGLPWGI